MVGSPNDFNARSDTPTAPVREASLDQPVQEVLTVSQPLVSSQEDVEFAGPLPEAHGMGVLPLSMFEEAVHERTTIESAPPQQQTEAAIFVVSPGPQNAGPCKSADEDTPLPQPSTQHHGRKRRRSSPVAHRTLS